MDSGVVLVPCVARSGSSVVARVLEERFGIDMGGPGLVRPENPDGIYERDWQAKLDTLLTIGRVSVVQWARLLRENMKDLAEPFGLKHPMNTGHYAYYLVLFPDAVIIRPERKEADVADSWQRVYGTNPKSAELSVRSAIEELDTALNGVDHLPIDMTERWTEDEIVAELDGYRGLEAL